MTGGRGANSFGRSMIEMLGVLAIIGVLSVGGIAGYSKAMEKFKVNKLLYEYNTLIMGLLEHRESIIKSVAGKSGHIDLSQFVSVANLAPATWTLKKSYLEDGFGNWVSPYAQNDIGLTNDFSRIGVVFYLNGQSDRGTADNFSEKLCAEMFSNLIIPLKSFIQRGYVYKSQHNLSDTLYMGDKYCGKNSKCLHNMTLSDIRNVCNDCDKANESCQIIISF